MQRIKKNKGRRALEFKKRYKKGELPAKYNSAACGFYCDVLIDLLNCQNGLCAYTEQLLISNDDLAVELGKFVKGKYTGVKPEIFVDIDHFEASPENHNWNWDNLFAVDSRINRDVKRPRQKKHGGQINWQEDSFIKPDSKTYSPSKYLDYDLVNHLFIAKTSLPKEKAQKVETLLYILGVNFGVVKRLRREYILSCIAENREPEQFITAFGFYKKKKKGML